jgi:hypothetical protein
MQFVQYQLSSTQAEMDAQVAVSSAVRIAQGGMRQSGDNDVTLLPVGALSLPPSSHWTPHLKHVEWTYKPWPGAQRQSFTYTVCFGSGALFADAHLHNARWQVQLSQAALGDCPKTTAR